MKRNIVPLIVEAHPPEYTGYPFLTLLQYRNDDNLVIVDNYTKNTIKAYVMDLCQPQGIDQESILTTAEFWFNEHQTRYPISFAFSMEDMSSPTNKILRTFNVDYVTRVIGPLPKFPMDNVKKIRKRKRKPPPPNSNLFFISK